MIPVSVRDHIARGLRHIRRGDDGSAVMEFGLIAPVFMLLLMGTYDLAHMVYAKALFAGAVERAARAAALEGADTAALDLMVTAAVEPVLPGVDVETSRQSYFDFADIDRAETFDDENGDDICNNGETYIDENRSGTWEGDVGVSGNGGAGDVVIYTATATYPPLVKIPMMPERWNERTLTATAVKKNQPFGNQMGYATTTGTCTS